MPADLQLLVNSAYRKVAGAPEANPPVPDAVVIVAIRSPTVQFRDMHAPDREFELPRQDFRAIYEVHRGGN